MDFYIDNRKKLEDARNTMEVDGLMYPQMKLLDIVFGQMGYNNWRR